MRTVIRISDYRRPPYLNFTRTELNRLLSLYSSRVICGDWRDYAISHTPGAAMFAMFKSSSELPLYVITKLETKGQHRTGRARKGRYVVSSRQAVLKQSDNLEDVLAVFDRPVRLVSG